MRELISKKTNIFLIYSFLILFLINTLIVKYSLYYNNINNTILLYLKNSFWNFENLNLFFKIFTNLADYIFIFIISFLIFIFLYKKKDKIDANFYALNLISGTFLIFFIKYITNIQRPQISQIQVNFLSYPSGHTFFAILIALSLYIIYFDSFNKKPNKIILFTLIIYIILIGFSRIYLGVHYFSDIIGSIFLSLFLISLNYYLTIHKKLLNKKY